MEINKSYFGCFGVAKTKIKPTAIVIHHTCTSNHKSTINALKKQGYSTHFEIEKDGTIYQYRDVHEMCCHCGSSNFTTIGIDITHLQNTAFTKEQEISCVWLVTYLCKLLGIPQEVHEHLEGIYPHKAICNTACPQNFNIQLLDGAQYEE